MSESKGRGPPTALILFLSRRSGRKEQIVESEWEMIIILNICIQFSSSAATPLPSSLPLCKDYILSVCLLLVWWKDLKGVDAPGSEGACVVESHKPIKYSIRRECNRVIQQFDKCRMLLLLQHSLVHHPASRCLSKGTTSRREGKEATQQRMELIRLRVAPRFLYPVYLSKKIGRMCGHGDVFWAYVMILISEQYLGADIQDCTKKG